MPVIKIRYKHHSHAPDWIEQEVDLINGCEETTMDDFAAGLSLSWCDADPDDEEYETNLDTIIDDIDIEVVKNTSE